MKKKAFFVLLLLLLVLFIPVFFYWKNLATSVVFSAFDKRFGLSLKYDRCDVSMFPGRIALHKPRLLDSLQKSPFPLASADVLKFFVQVQKVIQGELDLNRIYANKLSVEVIPSPDGELNWSQALQRLRREHTTGRIALAKPRESTETNGKIIAATPAHNASVKVKAATGQSAAKPLRSQAVLHSSTFPIIDIDDLLLNYHKPQQAETNSIRMEHFRFDPRSYDLTIQNGRVFSSGQGDVRLSIKNLNIKNAFAPDDPRLVIAADAVHLNGQQTGERQYDFNEITLLWLKVYRQIGDTVTKKKTPSEERGFPIESLKASNVSAFVLPQGSSSNAPGALFIEVNHVAYELSRDELTLTGVTLKESETSLLSLDRIVLTGIADERVSIQEIAIQGGRLDIFEDGDGRFNISRAIEHIRDIIESMMPQSSKTARARPVFLETLKSASLDDSVVNWRRPDESNQQIAVGQLRYEAAAHLLGATDVLLTRREGDRKTIVSVSSIVASPSGALNERIWNRLILYKPAFEFSWRPDRYELVDAASDWISLPGLVAGNVKTATDEREKNPFLIRDMQIQDADVRIMDYTLDPPLPLRLASLTLQWSDVQFGSKDAPMTPLNLEAILAEPSAGSLAFQGRASSSGMPLNVTGTAMLAVSDITVFNPYLEASEKALPVRIIRGGLRSNARAAIQDNKVDGVIDLYLYDPVFEPNNSKWPFKIDRKTVIATLNNLKDKNGVIAFPNNKWSGDIRDPKFKRGLGIDDLFWSNMQGTLTTVLKLPLDIAGSVGNVFMRILGQDR